MRTNALIKVALANVDDDDDDDVDDDGEVLTVFVIFSYNSVCRSKNFMPLLSNGLAVFLPAALCGS